MAEKKINKENINNGFSIFEKVLVASERAKMLYELDDPARASLQHKPGYQSIDEINKGKIRITKNIETSEEENTKDKS